MEINHRVILGENVRQVSSSEFQGGTLTAILASSDLDLRGAELTSPAVLKLQAFLAEVDITVPNDWEIDVRTTTPIAEFKDMRRGPSNQEEKQNMPTLILTGFATVAEVTLRD